MFWVLLLQVCCVSRNHSTVLLYDIGYVSSEPIEVSILHCSQCFLLLLIIFMLLWSDKHQKYLHICNFLSVWIFSMFSTLFSAMNCLKIYWSRIVYFRNLKIWSFFQMIINHKTCSLVTMIKFLWCNIILISYHFTIFC